MKAIPNQGSVQVERGWQACAGKAGCGIRLTSLSNPAAMSLLNSHFYACNAPQAHPTQPTLSKALHALQSWLSPNCTSHPHNRVCCLRLQAVAPQGRSGAAASAAALKLHPKCPNLGPGQRLYNTRKWQAGRQHINSP